MNNSFQNTFGFDHSSDSSDQTPSVGEDIGAEDIGAEDIDGLQQPTPDESTPPEFGLLDVIDAFTAMRHEWRTQTRENRDLSAVIQGATEHLLRLETERVDSSMPVEQTEQGDARELVDAIVEIDIHLSRAVDAAIKSTRSNSLRNVLDESIRDDFANRGIISRWLCRRFFKSVLRRVAAILQENVDTSTSEGLTMVVSRIRRIMSDCDIQRAETVGQPFDAATMHAIASVESDQQSVGYVDEQISPAYFWRGELFRCADVRVTI